MRHLQHHICADGQTETGEVQINAAEKKSTAVARVFVR